MAAPTIVTGILTGGSNNHTTSSEEANAHATDFISEGIVGSFTNTSGVSPATGAFAVNATGTPDTNINISTGVAYVQATPTSQNSQTIRVKCTVTGTLAISANSSGSTKYDWIYISVSAANAANPAVGADNVATIVASRSTSASTDDGTPPTYGYPIAVVTVANGFTTIINGNIRDTRANSTVNLGSSSVSSGWIDLGYTPNTITYNGNRSYSVVYNSVDLTSTLSNGMRLKHTRLVTAPTQSTSLNGSTQYYSKTSPAGLSFTDDWTCMAWVKLSSYATGGIIARRNADTEGWSMGVNSSGQVTIGGYRVASNNAVATSNQSLPLNKWVHVAASYDMSGTTAHVYIDGIDMPVTKVVTGTATSLVQGTTALVVGAEKSAGTNPFAGKIAQAAVFSAVISQATIQTYISQGLAGSETSLVSAYSFNNSIVDLKSGTANDLTAQGSAVATNADSPFGLQANGTTAGTTDYGIITGATFSTNTTLTVQIPEGNTIPTSGGISAVAYSTQKVPLNFPAFGNRWSIEVRDKTQASQSSPVSGTWYNLNSIQTSIPIGEWRVGYLVGDLSVTNSTNVGVIYATLSTANNSESDPDYTIRTVTTTASANSFETSGTKTKFLSVSAQTSYFLNSKTIVASASSIVFGGSNAPTLLVAEFSYL